jgi:two-component system phosphate regulon sensor histidine kinase PhoR
VRRRVGSRIVVSHLLIIVAAVLLNVLTDLHVVVQVLLLVVLAVALAVPLSRSITRPITNLARSVQRRTRGDRRSASAGDELAHLATSLNSMAAELRALVDEVADERDRARQILDSLDSGVLLLGVDGSLRLANQAARTWLALSDAHTGMPARRVLAMTELGRLVERVATTGEPAEDQMSLVFPEHRTLSVRVFPLVERGIQTGVVVTLIDLTGQHRLDALRRDFVVNASHELKTPVAAITALSEGAATALEDGDLEMAGRFLARVDREAERLDRLVRDLLDLSKVEGGTLAIEPVDLAALIADVTGRYAERAAEKRIDVGARRIPKVTIRGDHAHLDLLVSNLLDNAVRYTEPGGCVRVRLTDRTRVEGQGHDSQGHVVLEVEDTGRGIPSRDLPRVFERFYRVDRARDRGSGGTGLGLAIVRHVAETHGGKVSVASELGRGTTFTVLLPSEPPAARMQELAADAAAVEDPPGLGLSRGGP